METEPPLEEQTMTSFGMSRQFTESFDQVAAKLPEALKTEGFGVLTTIDMQKTLKEKIGATFRRYTIFGACNPNIANEALGKYLEFGLMMPCNVLVYEDEGGKTTVRAIDPEQTFAPQMGPEGVRLAGLVKEKLKKAIERI
jgi:uncharacterized protein (DUF302 family)